jgi:hypothetical protein
MNFKKGSISVETSIYISVLMLITVFFMYLFLILSYKAQLEFVLDEVVEGTALSINDKRLDIETGLIADNREISIIDELYRNPLTFRTYTAKYLHANGIETMEYSHNNKKINSSLGEITEYIKSRLEKGRLAKPGTLMIEAKLCNSIANPFIELKTEAVLKLPVIDFTDKKKGMRISVKRKKDLVLPQDTIRNVDLVVEYADKIFDEIDFKKIIEKIVKKKE